MDAVEVMRSRASSRENGQRLLSESISNLPYHVIMLQHVTLASWLDDKSGDKRGRKVLRKDKA